jgi:hypothetical protein
VQVGGCAAVGVGCPLALPCFPASAIHRQHPQNVMRVVTWVCAVVPLLRLHSHNCRPPQHGNGSAGTPGAAGRFVGTQVASGLGVSSGTGRFFGTQRFFFRTWRFFGVSFGDGRSWGLESSGSGGLFERTGRVRGAIGRRPVWCAAAAAIERR